MSVQTNKITAFDSSELPTVEVDAYTGEAIIIYRPGPIMALVESSGTVEPARGQQPWLSEMCMRLSGRTNQGAAIYDLTELD